MREAPPATKKSTVSRARAWMLLAALICASSACTPDASDDYSTYPGPDAATASFAVPVPPAPTPLPPKAIQPRLRKLDQEIARLDKQRKLLVQSGKINDHPALVALRKELGAARKKVDREVERAVSGTTRQGVKGADLLAEQARLNELIRKEQSLDEFAKDIRRRRGNKVVDVAAAQRRLTEVEAELAVRRRAALTYPRVNTARFEAARVEARITEVQSQIFASRGKDHERVLNDLSRLRRERDLVALELERSRAQYEPSRETRERELEIAERDLMQFTNSRDFRIHRFSIDTHPDVAPLLRRFRAAEKALKKHESATAERLEKDKEYAAAKSARDKIAAQMKKNARRDAKGNPVVSEADLKKVAQLTQRMVERMTALQDFKKSAELTRTAAMRKVELEAARDQQIQAIDQESSQFITQLRAEEARVRKLRAELAALGQNSPK